MVEMLDEIIAAARKHHPKLIVALNGGPEVFPDEIQRRLAFLYAEPLPSASGIALGSIILRGWGRPDYQAGIFTMAPYYDALPESPFRVQADALLVQNSRVFFVGETPLVSNVDGVNYSVRWFDRAREAFADVRNVDCLLPGVQPVLSSAALYSQPTMQEMAAQKRPRDFRYSILGALENLTYSGRPVESLPEFRLTPELLRQLDTLVLPEVECLSDAHAALIAQWVREGGTLVASYKCGLKDENHQSRANFPLAEVLGVDFASEERRFAYDDKGETAPRRHHHLFGIIRAPAGRDVREEIRGTPRRLSVRNTDNRARGDALPAALHGRRYPPQSMVQLGFAAARSRNRWTRRNPEQIWQRPGDLYRRPYFLGNEGPALLDSTMGSRIAEAACAQSRRGAAFGAFLGIRAWNFLL